MRDKILKIETVESFDEIKSYLDSKIVNAICDDNMTTAAIDLSSNNIWLKFTHGNEIYALFMLRPLNSITVEIHPMIKREFAMYADICGEMLMDRLKEQGKKQATCVFPVFKGAANIKLALKCGFEQVGEIADGWLKCGKLYSLAIYQRSL